MIGVLLLLLKGRSGGHVTCKALCPFQTETETHSNCGKTYKLAYKVTVTDLLVVSACVLTSPVSCDRVVTMTMMMTMTTIRARRSVGRSGRS